ncbi:hypothetical protein NEOKW01_1434 [Nematocida sp. AWRm80]|nr:hypothetical protein NEOKW01_1434 [Nematocida sp. AWRm80]
MDDFKLIEDQAPPKWDDMEDDSLDSAEFFQSESEISNISESEENKWENSTDAVEVNWSIPKIETAPIVARKTQALYNTKLAYTHHSSLFTTVANITQIKHYNNHLYILDKTGSIYIYSLETKTSKRIDIQKTKGKRAFMDILPLDKTIVALTPSAQVIYLINTQYGTLREVSLQQHNQKVYKKLVPLSNAYALIGTTAILIFNRNTHTLMNRIDMFHEILDIQEDNEYLYILTEESLCKYSLAYNEIVKQSEILVQPRAVAIYNSQIIVGLFKGVSIRDIHTLEEIKEIQTVLVPTQISSLSDLPLIIYTDKEQTRGIRAINMKNHKIIDNLPCDSIYKRIQAHLVHNGSIYISEGRTLGKLAI